MLKKIKKIFIYTLFGLGLVYTSCGSEDAIIINQNNKPVIITDSLEDAVAGEYYTKQIDTYDGDDDSLTLKLINAPEGMVLEDNTLKWSPRHSKLGPNYSQTGHFDLELSVTDGTDTTFKELDLFVLDTSSLDYLRTDKNIRPTCESSCFFNENYLDLKSKGVFNGINKTKEKLKSDIPEIYKPVDYHLQLDSECTAPYPNNSSYLSMTSDGRELICNFISYDSNGNGFVSPWASGPDAIEDQTLPIHEYIHGIFNGKPNNGPFIESFAWGISNVITKYGGYLPDLNSLCDIRNNNFPLANELCNLYNFDMKDLPELLARLKVMSTSTVQDAKCIIDDMKKTNTYTAFSNSSITVDNTYCGN